MWQDLSAALCLVLVIEGIMPFVAPGRWRSMAYLLTQLEDRPLRIAGLCSMLLGAGLLFIVR